MTQPPLPEPRAESPEPTWSPPAPLERLKRWPDACRPDVACEIEGTVYPPPNELDAESVLWWIDYVQIRVGAARSMVSNVIAAVVGAVVGAAVAFATLSVTENPWMAMLAALGALVLSFTAGWYMLHDSEHHALEQRWMLYRRRARELGMPW